MGWAGGSTPLVPYLAIERHKKEEQDHRSRGFHKQYYADDVIDWEHTYSWVELGSIAVGCIPAGKIAQLAKSAAGKALPYVIKRTGVSFTALSVTENDRKTRHGIKISIKFRVIKSRFCQWKEFKVDHCARDIRESVKEGDAIVSSCNARIV